MGVRKGRVVLINGIFNTLRLSEPIGICSIAAVLREAGHEVYLIEPRMMSENIDEIVDYVHNLKPDYIGLSTFSFERDKVYDMAAKIKQKSKQHFIVMGGLGPTLTPELYLNECRDIDAVLRGEGEFTSLKLLEYLLDEDADRWKECPGIVYRDDSGLCMTEMDSKIEDLDILPFMARDMLEKNFERYGLKYVTACIMGSRGCFGNCSYCWIAEAQERQPGLRYRQRSVESIVKEIEYIVNKYGVTDFSFEDDNFLPPGQVGIDRARGLRDALKKANLNITFFMQTRPDTLSEEALAALKEAGLKKLFIGIEAVEEEDLSIYNKEYIKKVSPAETLKLLAKYGFIPDVGNETKNRLRFGYIAFHQLTTVDSVEASVKFFREYNLTPKRLLKRVRYFEGDIDIKKKLQEKGLLSSKADDEAFAHANVGLIYDNIMHYADEVLVLREAIRDIEKHVFRRKGNKDGIEVLCEFREFLDHSFYDAFDILIGIAKRNDIGLEEMNMLMQSSMEKEIRKINDLVKARNIKEEIRLAGEKYEVIRGMHNIYW